MYFDTRLEYEYQLMNERIEKEMYNTRNHALKKLGSLVAHSKVEAFSRILSYSWFDSFPEAEKIAEDLDLGKLDFLAINEEIEAFKEEYLITEEVGNF